MAKERCPICGIEKAKRTCKIKDALQICSICCAKLRYSQCAGCAYYADAVRYRTEKPRREKHFITQINPEIDEECNKVLSMVESGHLSRGEKLMRELYKKYPDYHTVLYGMGVCHALQDKFEEAIEFFKRAVDIFPYFSEAHFNMAMASTKMGDIAGMVKGLREVIRIGGDEELVSEAKRRLDDLDKKVREINGFNLDTYLKNSQAFEEAFSALQNRQFKLAIDLFRRVLSVDPKHVQSWGNMGLAYAGIGEREKALECLDMALKLDPEYEIAAVNRIVVEQLKEGETFEGEIDSVHYYRDYKVRSKRSYIAEMLGKMGGLFKR